MSNLAIHRHISYETKFIHSLSLGQIYSLLLLRYDDPEMVLSNEWANHIRLLLSVHCCLKFDFFKIVCQMSSHLMNRFQMIIIMF